MSENETQDLIERLRHEKESANKLQERKHENWNDNYELYRNKVRTNRLTQRQAVNIPLMKETIKTLLSKVDDAPDVNWQEMGGDEDKEILFQEIWNANFRENKLELVDVLDKKNVLLYGISAKKLNIGDEGIEVEALDVYDLVFDPLMQTSDIETARFIIHQNIFRTVKEILADDRYTNEGKKELKIFMDSGPGITQGEDNREKYEEKLKRLEAMGVDHNDFDLMAGGDRIVNLTEHYTRKWNTKDKKWERWVVVYADDNVILSEDKLTDLIGVDFYPFVVWNEDPETNDIYPDGVADMVRDINKVVNVWFSQLIENRTLKNFQMHWFLPTEGYSPQTYTPGPGVMLPAPPGDDISKVIKPVEISGLDDTLTAISALTNIVERGTGATAIDKGQTESGTQTLGEIQILVGKATERAIGMAKFYRMSWYELAWKWAEMMHKNAPKVLKLYKNGRSGRLYTKKVMAGDWKSEQGYRPIIRSSSEHEQEAIKTIQKFIFVLQQFPENGALKEIAQKRMLESLDLTPEELSDVENFQQPEPQRITQPQQPQQQGEQINPELLQGIDQSLTELGV